MALGVGFLIYRFHIILGVLGILTSLLMLYLVISKYKSNPFIEITDDFVNFKGYVGDPKKVMYDDVEEFVYEKKEGDSHICQV